MIPGAGPDQFKFASFMSVTLSCDHRVIDGKQLFADWIQHSQYHFILTMLRFNFSNVLLILCIGAIGAEWLKSFKGYIENPETMLL